MKRSEAEDIARQALNAESQRIPDWVIDAVIRAHDAQQAKIDALMLEYCPQDMTSVQKAVWAAHQTPVPVAGQSIDGYGYPEE